jgi:hypothetical protein
MTMTTFNANQNATLTHYGSYRRAGDAMAHANGWEDLAVILLEGRYYVVEHDEADRLAELGVSFAHVGTHAGRTLTVPVN